MDSCASLNRFGEKHGSEGLHLLRDSVSCNRVDGAGGLYGVMARVPTDELLHSQPISRHSSTAQHSTGARGVLDGAEGSELAQHAAQLLVIGGGGGAGGLGEQAAPPTTQANQ